MPTSKAEPVRKVSLLPKQWLLAFVASWRTFEKTLNPAFSFLLKCNNCGAAGVPEVNFVTSVKNPRSVLGIECTQCLTTVKFEGTIDPDAEDFPTRLLARPTSVLEGDKPKRRRESPEGIMELILE